MLIKPINTPVNPNVQLDIVDTIDFAYTRR